LHPTSDDQYEAVARATIDKMPDEDLFTRRDQPQSADVHFDRMAQIEADVLAGKVEPSAGRTVLSSMQWRLSKLSPRRFGDRLQVAGDVEQPLVVQREISPLESARQVLFAMELARRADELAPAMVEVEGTEVVTTE
jgi:hypothetical protein